MSSFFRDPKRLIATVLAGAAGLIVLADFTGLVPMISPLALLLVNWVAILSALALLVGLANVVSTHAARVRSRQPDWIYSLVLLLAMLAVIVSGTLVGLTTDEAGVIGRSPFFPELSERPIRDLFRLVYQPLAASLLALLTFFALSAALRATRRRTAEASVILLVAAFVLLMRLPQVAALPGLGTAAVWLNEVLAQAGARALLLGTAIGALVASMRVLLGFDQPYLDR